MTRNLHRCLESIAAATLLLALAGQAQAQTPLALSLDDAIDRGVAHAPRLAESRSKEAAASATIASRHATSAPNVSVSSGYLRTNHVDAFSLPQPGGGSRVIFPDIPNNYQTKAEVDVPVYTGGRTGALTAGARSDLDAAVADTRAAEQDVRLQVAVAYWTLVNARASIGVLEESNQRMDAWVSDVKARVDAGVLPPNELLSAQAERSRQSVQLIQARNQAAFAEADLGRLIGAAPGQPIQTTSSPDQPMARAAAASAKSLDTLVVSATDQRSEFAALRSRQASFLASGQAALASLRPTILASANVEPARPNQLFVPRVDQWKTSWGAAVNVSWSLFDGGKARADHAAAVAQADALSHRQQDLTEGVTIEIRQHLLDLQSGTAAIDASNDAVAAATEAQRVVTERFRAGVATSTDVLDAQIALREAELERTRLAVTQRITEARLLRATGGL